MSLFSKLIELKSTQQENPWKMLLDLIFTYWRIYNEEKDDMFPILIDMFKYYKQRIDYKHYNITLNEENTEILTEETIKELV